MAACFYMGAVGGKIPSSISKQAEHWSKSYNTKKEHPREPKEIALEVKELEVNTSGTICVAIIYIAMYSLFTQLDMLYCGFHR